MVRILATRWPPALRRDPPHRTANLLVLIVVAAAGIATTTATSTISSSSSSSSSSRPVAAAWIPCSPPHRSAQSAAASSSWWRSRSGRSDTTGPSTTALAAGQHRGSSGTQRGRRRRDAGGGGGGGGKPSYKEREKSRRDSSSLPLPMPPVDEGEEEEGNKPENWPEKILFGQKLKWPSTSLGRAGTVKEAFRRRLLPGIRVKYIDDPNHILRGQYGVYAMREFNPFDIVGEYVGRVVPPEKGGEYVATIDWEDRRFEDGAGQMWGVDSGEYGNEIRMINHFARIAPVPNVKLVTAYVNELPHILAVVIRPIRIDQELLLDYGPNYWCSSKHAPPPEPPGIDDPPEELPDEVVWDEDEGSGGEGVEDDV